MLFKDFKKLKVGSLVHLSYKRKNITEPQQELEENYEGAARVVHKNKEEIFLRPLYIEKIQWDFGHPPTSGTMSFNFKEKELKPKDQALIEEKNFLMEITEETNKEVLEAEKAKTLDGLDEIVK